MRVAFYAPLKPPGHDVPSGDRTIARLLFKALESTGHDVFLASELRLYEGQGDKDAQQDIEYKAMDEAQRLIEQGGIDVWITYHHYAKAPDFIGSAVTAALKIPYVLIEASIAEKHAVGAYARWYQESVRIVLQADRVLQFNPKDCAAVEPLLKPGAAQELLPLFIDIPPLVHPLVCPLGGDAKPRLLTVAMHREGAKLRSYQLLAAALQPITAPWTLDIIGDGAARAAVEQAFAGFPPGRVRFLGAQAIEEMPEVYAAYDLFVWPAIDEALGMALLEAQAAGLPVIAGASPGVATLVEDGVTGLLPPSGDAAAFAAAVQRLLQDAALRRQYGQAGSEKARTVHGLRGAAKRLERLLHELCPAAR
ncbi:MAG: glycosyltransferase family 4 protein [Alphaproteobacteria bacterium]|jgi:glycosyltransferase involved in cell wall biosynthesis|nr:glycosyltransferase family 4 protein [Thalassospira sp.]MCE2964425.1 glycosyltransferase family 4 protein [Alphaproteobacteria bacterium]